MKISLKMKSLYQTFVVIGKRVMSLPPNGIRSHFHIDPETAAKTEMGPSVLRFSTAYNGDNHQACFHDSGFYDIAMVTGFGVDEMRAPRLAGFWW
ncbi:MAG: hypothetical protein H7A03_08805 [Pseudomonadales bacterium]|nr:hypothetical protein [Pseudomonadales bacterium]